MVLFYNERGFVGLGFDGRQVLTFNYGQEHDWLRIPTTSERLHLRLANDRHIVTMHYSSHGCAWRRHPWRYEVSGCHRNVFGGFLSLRPALSTLPAKGRCGTRTSTTVRCEVLHANQVRGPSTGRLGAIGSRAGAVREEHEREEAAEHHP
jgi:hypothetical protein